MSSASKPVVSRRLSISVTLVTHLITVPGEWFVPTVVTSSSTTDLYPLGRHEKATFASELGHSDYEIESEAGVCKNGVRV